MKLSHEYDGNGFKEVWVPAKTYTKQESTEALVELKKRTDEKIQKLHVKLQEKYMKPLVVSKTVKLVSSALSTTLMTTIVPQR